MSSPATRPFSLKTQLLFWLLAPILIISVVALIDAWRSANTTANQILDRVLAGPVLAIAERIVVGDNGALEIDIPYVALEMLTSSAQDRVFYRVGLPDGTFVTGYKDLAVPNAANPPLDEVTYSDGRFLGADIRLASYAGAASTGLKSLHFLVTVAETTNARVALAQSIFLASLLRQLVLMVAAPVVVWFAVTRALHPLTGLQQAIGRRSPEDLRPIARPVPIEMSGLLETTNNFLARLNSALGALRHFTGNASHQLRTPLAIMRTELALTARARTLKAAKAHAAAADQSAEQAGRILSQLLLLARIDEAATRRSDPSSADLSAIARTLVADYFAQADGQGLDLGFDGAQSVTCAADPMLLSEMMRNLVENAIRYSGTGGEITVRTLSKDGTAFVEVVDSGPGIPDDQKAAVLERFNRGDRSGTGTGLGLSVVKEIAELYGGGLALLDAPGGGLIARVNLRQTLPPKTSAVT